MTTDKPLTFGDWLITQAYRADTVGDIAKVVIADHNAECLDLDTTGWADIYSHAYRAHGASDLALAALDTALLEYEAAHAPA